MKTDDLDDLHWPDAVEMERALRRAHAMRSKYLADLAHRGTAAIGRVFGTMKRFYFEAQRRVLNS